MTQNLNRTSEDEIDVKEIWRVFRSYYKSLIFIFGFVLSITIYVTLTTHPVWESTSAVLLKDRGSDPSSFVFDFGF